MKLIQAMTLEITEFSDHNIPPYAILSHTWVQNEEISYQEVMNREWGQKSGFEKVKKCCSQALKDGFEWVWVDTCSIDKTSSAELSEAINTMFRYYSQAAICYAYLADVEFADPVPSSGLRTVVESFRKSRWFTRGWTLQELLAPSKLVFYSASWDSIGDRSEWRDEISQITSIPYLALTQGTKNLTQFSIADRMSWAASRTTSREEDMAYCMLGIFGVHMPLLYGEGGNAFIRLQEEIMKTSDDQTIFAWQNPEATGHTHLLSSTPKHFRNSSMRPLSSWEQSQPYSMTNAGLQLTGILIYNPSRWEKLHILCLPVYDESKPDLVVGLPLIQLSKNNDQFARSSGCLMFFPTLELQQMGNIRLRSIYVRKEAIPPSLLEEITGRRLEFRILIDVNPQVQVHIEEAYPERQIWSRSSERFVITPPERQGISSRLDGGSWHIAIVLSLAITWTDQTPAIGVPFTNVEKAPALAFSETCRCILFVGYNGRTDRTWCALDNISIVSGVGLAQSSWRQFPKTVSDTISKLILWKTASEDGFDERKVSGVEISANLQNATRKGLGTEYAVKKGIRLGRVNLTTNLFKNDEASTGNLKYEEVVSN